MAAGRNIAIRTATALVAVAALTACVPKPGPTPSLHLTPGPIGPTTPAGFADDCRGSDNAVTPQAGALPGGTFSLRTDNSRTSLLITNTSLVTLVVVPQTVGTRLAESPYADPTDLLSTTALNAVIGTDLPRNDPTVAGFASRDGIPYDQIFVVPPQWSVCALGLVPAAFIAMDRFATAEYKVTMAIGQAISNSVTPQILSRANTLQKCATGTYNFLNTNPDPNSFEFYSGVIGTGSDCYKSYTLLVNDDAAAAGATEARAAQILDETPSLIEDSEFFLEFLH
jgi:hypothetical protein